MKHFRLCHPSKKIEFEKQSCRKQTIYQKSHFKRVALTVLQGTDFKKTGYEV